MSVRKRRTAVITAAVASLALAGGVAAQFTTSTTSAPQSIGTGTLALAIDNVAPTVWTDEIANLAAGDSVERFFDLRNAGTLKMSGVTVAQTNTLGDLIANPSDVSVKFEGCSVAWNAATGTCPTGAVSVLTGSSVRAWGANLKALNTLEDFGAGEVRHIKIVTSLSADATNAVQGKTGTITYTFGGTQRSAGTNGTVSDSTTTLTQPGAAVVTPSATPGTVNASFADPSNGAAKYELLWGPTGNAAAAQTLDIPKGTTGYTLNNLEPGTTYDLTLVGQLGVQKTTTTTQYTVAVAAPTGLGASGITATSARVSWTDTSGGKATHELTFTPAGGTSQMVTVPKGASTYALTGLTQGKTYAISLVAAVGSAKSSAATTDFTTPTALVASPIGGYRFPVGTVATSNNGSDAPLSIDGDINTRWQSAGGGGFLTLTMPSEQQMSKINVNINGGFPSVTVWSISDAGVQTKIGSVANTGGQVSVAVTPGSYKKIGLSFSSSYPAIATSINEVSFS